MKRNVIEKRNLDLDNYVNSETGELLLSEFNGTSITASKETNRVLISSDEYVVIDSPSLRIMCDLLSNVDYRRVVTMGNWLFTDFNVVFNNNVPHTLDTLAKALNMNPDDTRRFCKRLVEVNIMAYVVCAPSGFLQRIYMLNPILIRKRKTFHKHLLTFFNELKSKP